MLLAKKVKCILLLSLLATLAGCSADAQVEGKRISPRDNEDSFFGNQILTEKQESAIHKLDKGDILEVNDIRYDKSGDEYRYVNQTILYRYDGVKLLRIN